MTVPDLSDFTPRQSPIVDAIFAHYKKVGDSEPARGYLGASILGNPCDRFLWFNFRGCCREEFPGRLYRLFETGDLEEPRFVENLRAIGCTVHECDEGGEQFAVHAIGGHLSGHLDGCVLGVPGAEKTWHVLEAKTHSHKNFTKLVRDQVMVAFPKHYDQMQIYMHLTGMLRALYVAVDKDTDDLYVERVRYDKKRAEHLMERAERIITTCTPPDGISDRRDFWQCKFCSAKNICFGSQPNEPVLNVPALSCRQCCHATAELDGVGRWSCEKHHKSLSEADQASPCKDHLLLPGILPQFTPEFYGKDDSGNDFILFQYGGVGSTWEHGQGKSKVSSQELLKLNGSLLGNTMIHKAKAIFDGTVTGCCKDILDRYPPEKCVVLWEGRPQDIEKAWEDLRAPRYHESNRAPLASIVPLSSTMLPTHCAAEYADGIVVVSYTLEKRAVIMQLSAPDENGE